MDDGGRRLQMIVMFECVADGEAPFHTLYERMLHYITPVSEVKS